MSDKITASVYKISVDKIIGDSNDKTLKLQKISEKGPSVDGLISWIQKNNAYSKKWNKDDRILHRDEPVNLSWKNFFKDLVDDDHILIKGKNKRISHVTFFGDLGGLYAITGGVGYHIIKDYVEDFFGIELFCRIFDKMDVLPSFLRHRGYVGKELMSESYYRKDHKLIYEDDFGKIYSAIAADLPKSKLKSVFKALKIDNANDITFHAKDSFTINKSLCFNDFSNLCIDLENIQKRPNKFSLNGVVRLDVRKNEMKGRITALENEIDLILQSYIDGKDTTAAFELMSSKYPIEFLSSNYYHIVAKGRQNPIKRFDEIKYCDFKLVVETLKKFYSEEDEELTIESLRKARIFFEVKGQEQGERIEDLLACELVHNGKPHFRIDRFWYSMSKSYLQTIDTNFDEVVAPLIRKNILLLHCDKTKTEEDYIEKYFGREGFLPLHPIKIHNIELCDLMYFDEEKRKTYVIHVKRGVDAIVRDVTSQCQIAGRIIREDKANGGDLLDKYHQAIKGKAESDLIEKNSYQLKLKEGCKKIKKADLKKYLHDFEVIYCIALIDTRLKTKPLDKGKNIQSNIAKFSLIDAVRRSQSIGINLNIFEIPLSK